jgi:hypothetical protein
MKVQEYKANQRTAAISVRTSVYRAANSICIGTIGSVEGASFGGVIREVAPGVREGVSTLFAGVMTPGIAPVRLPKDDGPVAGVRGSLGVVVPETAGGLVPKLGATLKSGADGASVTASGSIPANRLGVVVVACSTIGFVSGFRPEPPSEKPIQPEPIVGGVADGPVTREEVGLLLRGVPFAVSSGGDFGLGIKDGRTALVPWSTGDSNFVGGGVGEGALAPSHFPNAVFGDAGRGLSEEGFSPLTSSSSPPDTGTFASGELRSGRVLGLPRLLLVELGDGDGVWEGDGSMGVGC